MIEVTKENLMEFVGSPSALLADSTTPRERALMRAMRSAMWATECDDMQDIWLSSLNEYLKEANDGRGC